MKKILIIIGVIVIIILGVFLSSPIFESYYNNSLNKLTEYQPAANSEAQKWENDAQLFHLTASTKVYALGSENEKLEEANKTPYLIYWYKSNYKTSSAYTVTISSVNGRKAEENNERYWNELGVTFTNYKGAINLNEAIKPTEVIKITKENGGNEYQKSNPAKQTIMMDLYNSSNGLVWTSLYTTGLHDYSKDTFFVTINAKDGKVIKSGIVNK
jgi:hypothetical protein